MKHRRPVLPWTWQAEWPDPHEATQARCAKSCGACVQACGSCMRAWHCQRAWRACVRRPAHASAMPVPMAVCLSAQLPWSAGAAYLTRNVALELVLLCKHNKVCLQAALVWAEVVACAEVVCACACVCVSAAGVCTGASLAGLHTHMRAWKACTRPVTSLQSLYVPWDLDGTRCPGLWIVRGALGFGWH
eukprot:366345-Chlamydomonas_euryale.AAC.15